MKSCLIRNKSKIIMLILLLSTFLTVLNQTILFTAFPEIMKDFRITNSGVQWLTTIYMLVNGILIPITAFLIGRYTTRQLTIFALVSFTIGTYFSAISTSFFLLLLSRVIQAIGAGILVPLMQVVIFQIYPKERRGMIMGLVGLTIAFAPAFGPTISGIILAHFSWHYLFYLIIPIVLILLSLAIFMMKNVSDVNTSLKLDIPSVITSTLGFGVLLYGTGILALSLTGGLVSLVIGGLGIVGFVFRQKKLEMPMLNFKVFKSRIFCVSLFLVVLAFISLMVPQTVLPIFIQKIRGESVLYSAIILLPGAVASGVSALAAGRMYDFLGGKIIGLIGFSMIVVSMIPFIMLSETSSLLVLSLSFIFTMSGVSFITMPITTEGLNALPENLVTHGTAMINTFRQVGGSIGTAMLITIQTWVTYYNLFKGYANAQLVGIRSVFLGIFILGLVGLLLSTGLHNKGDS